MKLLGELTEQEAHELVEILRDTETHLKGLSNVPFEYGAFASMAIGAPFGGLLCSVIYHVWWVTGLTLFILWREFRDIGRDLDQFAHAEEGKP